MTYEEAVKVVWPEATVMNGRWMIEQGRWSVTFVTFDALLAVWRERLEPHGWYWEQKAFDTFWSATHHTSTGCTHVRAEKCEPWNPLHDFAILTALVLQAKEPKP